MLQFGRTEIDAFAAVARSGKLFRYSKGGHCDRFERRYARFLGVRHALLTASGTQALTAALGGLGLGPGDEVIVPAHTYMATAISVLAAGAIPVIVDVDDSITMSPQALDDAIGPRTRAVIPVHMWGLVCDMDAILRIARRRRLLVVEDACQCVGGAYEGRMAGSMGDAGAFSFNYFKNMTCGEGGAVVSNNESAVQRFRCMIDCCNYFWSGIRSDAATFAFNGARASEFEGAMMNAQLARLPGLIRTLRRIRNCVVAGTGSGGPRAGTYHSPRWDCGTTVLFQFASAGDAERFVGLVGTGTIPLNTGRHTYTEWDPVLNRQGGHHPALDPFRMPQNRRCRMDYSKDALPRSLDILGRTVMVPIRPGMTGPQVSGLIEGINQAAARLAAAPLSSARRRKAGPAS